MSEIERTRPSGAPVVADLLFWTVAAVAVISGSGRLAGDWGAPRPVLVAAAGVVLVSGLAGLLVRRALVNAPTLRWFGRANLAIAPVLLVAAVLDWLSLTHSGNLALTVAAAAAAVFGAWQSWGAKP